MPAGQPERCSKGLARWADCVVPDLLEDAVAPLRHPDLLGVEDADRRRRGRHRRERLDKAM